MEPIWQLALSTCDKKIEEDLFRAYRDAGITEMELAVKKEVYETLELAAIRRWAEQYGVHLWSFHFPFVQFDLSDPALAEESVACFCRYIDEVSAIGVRLFVVHASREPIADADRPMRMACAKHSLARLAEYAASRGCTIAVEDLPRSCLGNCSREILELISVHDALRVVFDTNHLLFEDIPDFIRAVGHKIVTMHVSDYDRMNERHWLPCEGCIDWQALIAALREVDYQGCWLYEVAFEAPWSIDRPRELTCRDFRDNYEALMQGITPPRIGTARANLGMWHVIA